jgi:hypothetical protein
MPVVTAHNRLLERFARQIPADAALSAQTPLHPHLSSRALIYPFPMVNDAAYVLLDVTARPTMHPNDLQRAFQSLVSNGGFGVLDAADGYILLKKGETGAGLPDAFYSAFRANGRAPQYPLALRFGDSLRLLGYDIEDVDEGRQPWTRLRLYWQASAPLPAGLRIYPYYLDDDGGVIEDTSQRPLLAALWLPPERWRPGDVIVTETLPWPVGDRFSVAVGVSPGGDWSNQAMRWPARLETATQPVYPLDGATAVEIGRFRRLLRLRPAEPQPPRPSHSLGARFGHEFQLLGYDSFGKVEPGGTVQLTLYWRALSQPVADVHTFSHVYDVSGSLVAQADGLTGGDTPPSWWSPGQVVTETYTIDIAPGAPPLEQSVSVGLYRSSGERLPVSGAGVGLPADRLVIPLK